LSRGRLAARVGRLYGVLARVDNMKKIVLALLVVFISSAAYAVPKGCFIAEYEASCHSAYFSSYDCDQYNMSSYNFGLYMKSMCD
jgi:hypothetical protein